MDMVNSNAARHLLLVVTVLLCFFVYMGHLIWGRSAAPDPDGDLTSEEIAGLFPSGGLVLDDPASAVSPSVPSGASSSSAMRPPASGGSVRPAGPGTADDAAPDLSGGLVSPSRRGEPDAAPSDLLRPPSGSFEETSSASGAITSLGPDRSLSSRPGLALDLPSGDDEPFSGGEPAEESAQGLSLPPSGGLRPSGTPVSGGRNDPPETAFLPPADLPVPAGTRPETASSSRPPASGVPDLPPPPGSGSALAPPPAAGGGTRPGSVTPPPTGISRPGSPTGNPGDFAPPVPAGTRPGTPRPPDDGDVSGDMRAYIIRPGDSLSRIAMRELGSASLANNIFLFNRGVIDDPDHLIVGTRILLPANDIGGGRPVPGGPGSPAGYSGSQTPPPTALPNQNIPPGSQHLRVHRVARGETLSSIAQRYYGSSSAWKFLHEANTDVIPNANQLQVGTELVIPLYGERE